MRVACASRSTANLEPEIGKRVVRPYPRGGRAPVLVGPGYRSAASIPAPRASDPAGLRPLGRARSAAVRTVVSTAVCSVRAAVPAGKLASLGAATYVVASV